MGGIIWLASYPKSGNTWMRAFLHNLLRNPPRPAPINELDQFVYGESSTFWYRDLGTKPIIGMDWPELMPLRMMAQQRITTMSPDSVFVKTHNYLGEVHDHPLHNMNLTAGTIYVVRNPLDVAISVTHHFGVDFDGAVERMADPRATTANSERHVPEYHSTWSQHVQSWTQTPDPGLCVVRYEDLLAKPFKTFGGIARFLGLKPPRERLQRAISFSSFKTLKNQEKTGDFKERSEHSKAFFRSGKRDQWRDDLTPDQIRRVISDHREQMERFGYVPKDYA